MLTRAGVRRRLQGCPVRRGIEALWQMCITMEYEYTHRRRQHQLVREELGLEGATTDTSRTRVVGVS